jgi:hypothetical protein
MGQAPVVQMPSPPPSYSAAVALLWEASPDVPLVDGVKDCGIAESCCGRSARFAQLPEAARRLYFDILLAPGKLRVGSAGGGRVGSTSAEWCALRREFACLKPSPYYARHDALCAREMRRCPGCWQRLCQECSGHGRWLRGSRCARCADIAGHVRYWLADDLLPELVRLVLQYYCAY